MLIKILIVLAVAFIGLLVFAAMRPCEFRVVRSALVGAPPDAVFPQLTIYTIGKRGLPGPNSIRRQRQPMKDLRPGSGPRFPGQATTTSVKAV